MCGLLMRRFWPRGPYGVREIGSKSKRRALWPIEAYWFFRPRLVDRFPLPLSDVLPALSSWDPPQLAPMRVVEPSSPDDLLSVSSSGFWVLPTLRFTDQPYCAVATACVTSGAL